MEKPLKYLLLFSVFTLFNTFIQAQSQLIVLDDIGNYLDELKEINQLTKSPNESLLPKPPEGKKWVKITSVSDEFNGDKLDTSKWMPNHPYWDGRNSKYTESNVSVKDGNLRLMSTLIKDTDSVKAQNISAACVTSNLPSCSYGYYETRLKVSEISMTSAFWFQGKYSEIDVIENVGKATNPESKWIESTMMINTHYFKNGWDNDIDTPLRWTMPGHSANDYYVYGVWWKNEKSAVFYCNGTEVGELTFGGPFDEKQYMFFDTEVFTWHGWPSKESLLDSSKNTMLVDWVRGWQLVDK